MSKGNGKNPPSGGLPPKGQLSRDGWRSLVKALFKDLPKDEAKATAREMLEKSSMPAADIDYIVGVFDEPDD